VDIPDEVKNFMIDSYAREAGVRSAKKNIRRIMEKLAFRFVQDPSIEKITVDK